MLSEMRKERKDDDIRIQQGFLRSWFTFTFSRLISASLNNWVVFVFSLMNQRFLRAHPPVDFSTPACRSRQGLFDKSFTMAVVPLPPDYSNP